MKNSTSRGASGDLELYPDRERGNEKDRQAAAIDDGHCRTRSTTAPATGHAGSTRCYLWTIPQHGLAYFDKRTTGGLFGWLRRYHKVQWAAGGDFVGQSELFAELERTATLYNAIELFPHEPPVEGVYYRHATPGPGDGSHLKWLLDRFRPETSVDRNLIQAAFLTAFWGGPAGRRPAFVITSDDGRGVGKSTVAEIVGHLCGGHLSFSTAGEDITTMKTRLLTPGDREKRIALMDNVKTMRFSWAELESLITESVISGKQLYVGEGQRPNLLTWFITINGASMATDMAQRSVIIKIVKGENDGKWWESTCKFIDDHRQEIIADILTQLRTAAEPPAGFQFSRWATWEQYVLCRLPDPVEAQRLILERQGDSDCETDEAEIVEEYFADQLRQGAGTARRRAKCGFLSSSRHRGSATLSIERASLPTPPRGACSKWRTRDN